MRYGGLRATLCVFLSGCGQIGSDGWEVTNAIDPMTDVQVQLAQTQLSGDRYAFSVAVECRSGARLHYVIRSFDGSGGGAPMRHNEHGTISFEFRADDQPATSAATYNPRYGNEISIESDWADDDRMMRLDRVSRDALLSYANPNSRVNDSADRLAAASRITLRIPMTDGVEIVTLDQTSPAVRAALDTCLNTRRELRDRLMTRVRQLQHEQERRRPDPIIVQVSGTSDERISADQQRIQDATRRLHEDNRRIEAEREAQLREARERQRQTDQAEAERQAEANRR